MSVFDKSMELLFCGGLFKPLQKPCMFSQVYATLPDVIIFQAKLIVSNTVKQAESASRPSDIFLGH